MIARTWHGATRAAKSDEYLEYLNKTGVPDLQATEGNQGVYVCVGSKAMRRTFF